MTERVILAILPHECECGHSWTEQEIITRRDTGYSYAMEYPLYLRILRREVAIEGTRVHATNKVPVCFQCVNAPLSAFGWSDHPSEKDYYDVQTPGMREALDAQANAPKRRARFATRTDQDQAAQKLIDDLIDL